MRLWCKNGVADVLRLLHITGAPAAPAPLQHAAVNVVADAVLRSRAGLASRQRGSSFLFLGPTGVGKTELAKALAALLFDDEKMMVRSGDACPRLHAGWAMCR